SRSFAAALRSDVERRSQQIAAQQPWADPRRAGAAAGAGADQVRLQARLAQSRGAIGATVAGLGGAADPAAALAGARAALAQWQDFAGLQFRAARLASPSAKPSMATETVSAEALPETARPT